jgi:hypothetical protein
MLIVVAIISWNSQKNCSIGYDYKVYNNNLNQFTMKTSIAPSDDVLSNVVIYNANEQSVETNDIRAALDAGKTVAVKHAKAGQLADVYPGTGCEVPSDLALFAIKQVPIPGHPDKKHTIITMIPEETTITSQRVSASSDSNSEKKETTNPVTDETIMREIKNHIHLSLDANNGLVPPAGNNPCFGIISLNFPDSGTLQNPWNEYNETTQTFEFNFIQSYYIYLTEPTKNNLQYNIVLVQSGLVRASNTNTLCRNDDNARVWVNNTINLRHLGAAGLTINSASGTNSSNPLIDTLSLPMQLVLPGAGDYSVSPFTASYSNSLPNPDWGVVNDPKGSSTLCWTYYNITGWNARTQLFNNFGQWSAQMYDSNDHVISLDNQCTGQVSFDNISVWTIAANSGNTSLPINFGLDRSCEFIGFANRMAGNGHHQAIITSSNHGGYLPTWDLVKVTNSSNIK